MKTCHLQHVQLQVDHFVARIFSLFGIIWKEFKQPALHCPVEKPHVGCVSRRISPARAEKLLNDTK